MADRATPEPSYYKAQNLPTEDSSELLLWWGMDMAKYYSPFKVEFKGRKVINQGVTIDELLTFCLVRDVNHELGPNANGILSVDLRKDSAAAWPQYPSTIPSADQFPADGTPREKPLYGFLFLSQEWQDAEQAELSKRGSLTKISNLVEDGKWPIGAFRLQREHAELKQRHQELLRGYDELRDLLHKKVKDQAARKELVSFIDKLSI